VTNEIPEFSHPPLLTDLSVLSRQLASALAGIRSISSLLPAVARGKGASGGSEVKAQGTGDDAAKVNCDQIAMINEGCLGSTNDGVFGQLQIVT
jgi:hypothetical protein